MKTIEINGFVLGKKDSWRENIDYTFHTAEMLEHGYMTIQPYVLRFELPDGFDPRLAQIEMLERQKEKLRADLGRRIQEIKEEISKLQAISFVDADEPPVRPSVEAADITDITISDVDGLPGHIPL